MHVRQSHADRVVRVQRQGEERHAQADRRGDARRLDGQVVADDADEQRLRNDEVARERDQAEEDQQELGDEYGGFDKHLAPRQLGEQERHA